MLPVFVCEELPFEAVRRVTGISAKVWEAGAKLKRLNEGSNVHHCLLPRKQAPSAPLRKVWDYFHEECSLVQIDKQTKVAWIEIISSPDSKLSASTIVNCSDFRLQKCFDWNVSFASDWGAKRIWSTTFYSQILTHPWLWTTRASGLEYGQFKPAFVTASRSQSPVTVSVDCVHWWGFTLRSSTLIIHFH